MTTRCHWQGDAGGGLGPGYLGFMGGGGEGPFT